MEFNRFDVSTKELIWDDPAAWLERLGIDSAGGVEIVDSDAAMMTSVADKVLRVGGDRPFLVDLEPHSYHDTEVARRMWLRHVSLDCRHNLPVLSVLLLLTRRANSPGLRGLYTRQLPDGRQTNRYHYRVVRLWTENPENYLNAGIAVVPLAPLTDVPRADLPGVVRRMRRRIEAEPEPRAEKLRAAAYFLMGLRYTDALVDQLLGGQTMRDSTTYQKVLREGRQEGLQEGRIDGERTLLIRQGIKKFGEPDAATIAAVEAIHDGGRIEAMGLRLIDADVQGWDDLLRSS